MKVYFTESALTDFDNLLQFYKEQSALETGRRLVSEIIKKSERLAKHPDSGRIVPEFGVPFLREIIFPSFRVVYRRDPDKIWIVRVWRGERLLRLE
jgi:plasmid stabilization system protein ParE